MTAMGRNRTFAYFGSNVPANDLLRHRFGHFGDLQPALLGGVFFRALGVDLGAERGEFVGMPGVKVGVVERVFCRGNLAFEPLDFGG